MVTGPETTLIFPVEDREVAAVVVAPDDDFAPGKVLVVAAAVVAVVVVVEVPPDPDDDWVVIPDGFDCRDFARLHTDFCLAQYSHVPPDSIAKHDILFLIHWLHRSVPVYFVQFNEHWLSFPVHSEQVT